MFCTVNAYAECLTPFSKLIFKENVCLPTSALYTHVGHGDLTNNGEKLQTDVAFTMSLSCQTNSGVT